MKNTVFLFTTTFVALQAFLPWQCDAQAPQKMSYQSVIRDNTGVLVADSDVSIRISILQGAPDGTAVFVETHAVTTNANGVASLQIGGGTVVTGGIAAIDWADGPYFIKTETDPSGGTDYTIAGTSELLSVPYALYANAAGTSGNGPNRYAAGDLALGGIVFYVNAAGTHGLVAALQDQSEASNWFTAQNNISNPVNHDEAGREYTDWRLPTRHELDLMHSVLHQNGLGGFKADFYWSSTESDTRNSWRQQFEDGRQALINKEAPNRVRAVRSF